MTMRNTHPIFQMRPWPTGLLFKILIITSPPWGEGRSESIISFYRWFQPRSRGCESLRGGKIWRTQPAPGSYCQNQGAVDPPHYSLRYLNVRAHNNHLEARRWISDAVGPGWAAKSVLERSSPTPRPPPPPHSDAGGLGTAPWEAVRTGWLHKRLPAGYPRPPPTPRLPAAPSLPPSACPTLQARVGCGRISVGCRPGRRGANDQPLPGFHFGQPQTPGGLATLVSSSV